MTKLVLVTVALVLGGSACADELEVHVINRSPWEAQIEFKSQNRNHVWPGFGKAYTLDDSAEHTHTLSCQTGERICYGAWTVANGNLTGRHYWGDGHDHNRGCHNCCWICGAGEAVIRLDQ
jgi:hypothetical protein